MVALCQSFIKVMMMMMMMHFYYICQVNGVKLSDILFSLLSVCVSVSTHI